MVRTWRFHCCGLGSVPGQGTKIPQATQHGQKKRKKSTEKKILHTKELNYISGSPLYSIFYKYKYSINI